jgi:hypothetical protein
MTHVKVSWARGSVDIHYRITPEQFAAYVAEKAASPLEGPARPELYTAPGPHEVRGFTYEMVEE